MSLIHLSTELRQELKLTPQLLQSMELLQMNSQELLDYLNQVSEENPLVEQTDLASLHKAYEALRQKVHWINGGLPEDGHGAMPDRGAADRETESLSAFLCDQLERRRLPKPLLALTRYLAELVDEEGRLSQEDLDGVADLKIPQALTQQALETLQSLDPAGVAGPGQEALQSHRPGAPYHAGGGPGGGEADLRPGPLPWPVLPAGGAHALCPAGPVHRGAGRKAPGDPERLLPPPGCPSASTMCGC